MSDPGVLSPYKRGERISGLGRFPGPATMARRAEQPYDVARVGTFDEIRERFYVISPERRIRHPAVAAITESGRRLLED